MVLLSRNLSVLSNDELMSALSVLASTPLCVFDMSVSNDNCRASVAPSSLVEQFSSGSASTIAIVHSSRSDVGEVEMLLLRTTCRGDDAISCFSLGGSATHQTGQHYGSSLVFSQFETVLRIKSTGST